MSKALTHETHYRDRTGSHATKGSKRGVNLLDWDGMTEEWLEAAQEREALVARAKQLHDLFSSPEGRRMPLDQRRVLTTQFNAINAKISALRPRMSTLTRGKGIQTHIVEVLKERLPKWQFQAAYEEAVRRCAVEFDSMNPVANPAKEAA